LLGCRPRTRCSWPVRSCACHALQRCAPEAEVILAA
jgi:hypothetical protein